MTRIELAPEVGDDFCRILDHLDEFEVSDANARIEEIVRAIDVLASNPLLGRPTREGLRELIIGRRSHGYVALYRYVEPVDTVFIPAIRSQKEAGYRRL
jgi:plasmid stabilization system protein ParE